MSNENLRVVTYNIGGGRKNFGSNLDNVIKVIEKLSPDILGIQECIEWQDADAINHSDCEQLSKAMGFGNNYYFGKTLSLQDNFHTRKAIMLYGLYNDWSDWSQGNAIFSKNGFVRLSNPEIQSHPQNVPLYRPLIYEGTRDTDPRYAIISRINHLDYSPYVVCTHLTTLVGERGGEKHEILGKAIDAQSLRFQQAKTILEFLRPKLDEKEIIILMGDFNASSNEASISSVLENEGEFLRLKPDHELPTHSKVEYAIDHIFIYPRERIKYRCWVDNSSIAQKASDHLPVIADINFQ